MDRTVNRDVLAAALGDYRAGLLPTADELMSLIAGAEIAAVRSKFDISDELLRTAWFLHGITAAAPDTPQYNPRQLREAFAVSAHIFDLALADERRDIIEQLRLAFAAQIGYRRCEQDPNATAIFHRVARLVRIDEDLPDHIDTLAVEAGVAFLGMQRAQLNLSLRTWRRQLADLRRLTERPSLSGTMYGPAEAVIEAVYHLSRFLSFGWSDELDRARDHLWSVVDHRVGSGDLWARWIASHLLELLDDLAASSLYTLLPDGTPPAVARTFALSDPAVLTLWPPQRKLLHLEHGNPLDPATSRSLISVPTSAGKTLMAQLVVCSHLARSPGRVIYVSPLRSLGREMRQALRARLRLLGRRLAAEQPDFPAADRDTDIAADLEILTPERLMHALRHDPVQTLQDVGLIVIDEAHQMAQDRRGFLLEGMLAYCQVHPAAPRMVLLSAAIGNRAALATWLAPDLAEGHVVFSDDWRGPRRLHGMLSPKYISADVVRTPRTASKNHPGTTRATVPVAMRMSLRPTATARPTELVTGPLGTRSFDEGNPPKWNRETRLSGTADYSLFAAGAAYLTGAGSVLMIVGTRRDARNTAVAIAEHLPERPQAAQITAYLADTLGPEHPLVSCANKGVAYHHAGLPDDVLYAIEEALRADQIRAIASTSTLTDGVNLPVRTVIIHSKVGEDFLAYAGQRRMSSAQLLNAVGRAGRAGRESEGWILLTRPRKPTNNDFDLMTPGDDYLDVTSALVDESALNQLAEAEDLLRESADAIFDLAGTLVADFAAYVWFTLDALSALPTLVAPNEPLRAVHRLLAMQQLDPEIRERWLNLANHVADQYRTADPTTRRWWTTTGTSLGTARTLDHLAETLASELLSQADPLERETNALLAALDLSEEWTLRQTLDFLNEHRVYDELMALPEAEGCWSFTHREVRGDSVLVDISRAINDWMEGGTIPALAAAWLPDISREWALEQAVENISQTFEHVLSWTLGALIDLVNNRLLAGGAPMRLRSDAAWYLRHGVDTEQAMALLTAGIASRRLAYLIGEQAQLEDIPATELRPWLTDLHIDGWKREFAANENEIADLLEYVRQRRDLFTELLDHNQTSIPVTVVEDIEAVYPEVTVTTAGPGSVPMVVRLRERQLATVPADSHTDIAAVLESGLDIAFALSENHLLLRRVQS